MVWINKLGLPLLVAALLLLPAAVAAQDQPVVIRSSPAIPNDFTLPPGDGEPAPAPVNQAPPPEPEAQPVAEPTAAPRPARASAPAQTAAVGAQGVAPRSARSPSAAPGSVPSAAASTAETSPDAQLTPPAARPRSAGGSVISMPLPPPDEAIIAQGTNWPLVGLSIMAAALLGLLVFLRRQRFQTLPARSEPLLRAPRKLADMAEPKPAPAPMPAPMPASPAPSPVAPPKMPAPAMGDGLVHARLPGSGLVTTNLAAKRRVQAAQAAPPAPPASPPPQKRPPRPPAVKTRISFEGF